MTQDELVEIVRDPRPERFWSYLRIEPREGGEPIPFTNLVPEQLDMTEKRLGYQDNFFLKSRNVGAGLHTQAYDFWYVWRQAWMGVPINTFITSHADETYERHIQRVVDLNDGLPIEMQLEKGRVNAHQCQFIVPGTRLISEFRGATAGGKRGQGRGFTFQRWHGTEFAYYDEGEVVVQSVTSAMHKGPHRSVTLETTPNGPNGYAPKLFDKWGNSTTKNASFYSWTMNPTHSSPFRPGLTAEAFSATLTEAERALVEKGDPKYRATLNQIAWRREKLENGNEDTFRTEYPFTVDEAFADSGDQFFRNEQLKRLIFKTEGKDPVGWRIYHPVQPGKEYAISIDIGNGSGDDGDDSVIQIFDCRNVQCAVYSDNTTEPTALGDMAYDTWLAWNQGVILFEDNLIGKTTRKRFEQLAGGEFAYRERRGKTGDLKPFMTYGNQNGGNKDEMFAHAKHMLDTNRVTILDRKTARQLLSIRRQRGGGIAAPKGSHDDHATSAVYAIWVTKNLRDDTVIRLAEHMRKHYDKSDRPLRRYGVA